MLNIVPEQGRCDCSLHSPANRRKNEDTPRCLVCNNLLSPTGRASPNLLIVHFPQKQWAFVLFASCQCESVACASNQMQRFQPSCLHTHMPPSLFLPLSPSTWRQLSWGDQAVEDCVPCIQNSAFPLVVLNKYLLNKLFRGKGTNAFNLSWNACERFFLLNHYFCLFIVMLW